MKKLLVLLALFACKSAFAQMPPPLPPTITVSGDAEEQVAPDRAVLALSLVNKDANLSKAKEDNDGMVERLVAIAREFKISKEKIATSNLYIAPEYQYEHNQRRFVGYTVSRSLRITIDKLEIHERLLSAIVDAKVDQVDGIEFQLSDREAHAASVRTKAFEVAKAKAETLAKAAGVTLGKPLSISTSGQGMERPLYAANVMMKAEAMDASSVAPSLPGMIDLRESVSVTFGLE